MRDVNAVNQHDGNASEQRHKKEFPVLKFQRGKLKNNINQGQRQAQRQHSTSSSLTNGSIVNTLIKAQTGIDNQYTSDP